MKIKSKLSKLLLAVITVTITTISAFVISAVAFAEGEAVLNEVIIENSDTAAVVISGSYGYDEYGNISDDILYTLTDNGVLSFSGKGKMYEPSGHSYVPWYSYLSMINTVVISDGITTVGKYAFYDCEALLSVTIPDSVYFINSYAFYNCSSLKEIVIPNSVTKIEDFAFCSCDALSSIVWSDKLTTIGYSAFNYCKALKEVVLPDSVSTIESQAFQYCTSLSSITLSKNITEIESYIFQGCTALKSITIPEGVGVIGGYAFVDCTALSSVSLPSTLTAIGDHAFRYCTSLRTFDIPYGVHTIGSNAFEECTSLASITLPDSIVDIGSYAFSCCKSLESISLPANLTYMSSSLLYDCDSLTDITIPDSVVNIDYYALSGCDNLESIVLPHGINTIAFSAFNSNAFKNITIGDYITDNCCSSVTNINCNVTVLDGTDTIGATAFNNCSKIVTISIPSSVTYIEYGAFDGCTGLTKIFYEGTAAQWEDIIGAETGDARIIYNYGSSAIPANVTATSGDCSVSLVWDDVCGAKKYAVSIYEDGSYTYLSKIIPEAFYTAVNLINGKDYEFVVQAYVNGKWSSVSATCTAKGRPLAKASDTKPVVFAQEGNNEVTLTWNAINNASCYTILAFADNKFSVATADCTNTEYTVTDLEGGKEYKFLVASNVKGYYDAYTEDDYVTATPIAVVAKPVVTATAGNSSATLSWKALSGATKYGVYKYLNGSYSAVGVTTSTSYTVSGLTNGTKYGFLVRAYANGTWSSFTTADNVYCTPTASVKPVVTATAKSGSVQLSWKALSGATKYNVYYYLNGKYTAVATTTATSYTVSGLTNGTKYGFLVRAYVNGAWTSFSSADHVYATPTAKPAVTATAKSGSVQLTWKALSGATKYNVYYYLNGKYTAVVTTTSTSYTVKGLTSGTKYGFLVRAYVNGAWTSFTTADHVYATPTV